MLNSLTCGWEFDFLSRKYNCTTMDSRILRTSITPAVALIGTFSMQLHPDKSNRYVCHCRPCCNPLRQIDTARAKFNLAREKFRSCRDVESVDIPLDCTSSPACRVKRPVASPRKYNTFKRLKMTSDVDVESPVPRCENRKQQPQCTPRMSSIVHTTPERHTYDRFIITSVVDIIRFTLVAVWCTRLQCSTWLGDCPN